MLVLPAFLVPLVSPPLPSPSLSLSVLSHTISTPSSLCLSHYLNSTSFKDLGFVMLALCSYWGALLCSHCSAHIAMFCSYCSAIGLLCSAPIGLLNWFLGPLLLFRMLAPCFHCSCARVQRILCRLVEKEMRLCSQTMRLTRFCCETRDGVRVEVRRMV